MKKSIIRNTLFILVLALVSYQMTGQQEVDLQGIIKIAGEESILAYQATSDNAVAAARWQLHKANLKPGINTGSLSSQLYQVY